MRRTDIACVVLVVALGLAGAYMQGYMAGRTPRQLAVLPSAWSPPGCAAEALGAHYVRWTCPIEETR